MVFLGIFRSDLQIIVNKGQNSALQGQTKNIFGPVLAIIKVFGLRFFSEWIFMIFLFDVFGYV